MPAARGENWDPLPTLLCGSDTTSGSDNLLNLGELCNQGLMFTFAMWDFWMLTTFQPSAQGGPQKASEPQGHIGYIANVAMNKNQQGALWKHDPTPDLLGQNLWNFICDSQQFAVIMCYVDPVKEGLQLLRGSTDHLPCVFSEEPSSCPF